MNESVYLTHQACVVCAILDNDRLILSIPIESRWFTIERVVIDAMLLLASRGDRIDIFSLSQIIGIEHLNRLIDIQKNHYGSKAGYETYLTAIRKEFEERETKRLVLVALKEIEGGGEASEVLSDLMSKITAVAMYDGANHVYNIKQAAKLFVEHLEDVIDAKNTGGMGISLGIGELDRILGSLQPSDLTIVGARPGVGKTSFCLSVLRNIAKTGKRVGFFSTEMSVIQVMQRFYSLDSGIEAHKLRYANLTDADYARLSASTAAAINLNFRICDLPAITVREIAMQARAWAANGGVDLIAIDYLTRIRVENPKGNQNLDIGNIVTELKNLARTLNIPVMCLAQLNRGPVNRADKKPMMSDLRDSGIIEQEADQILMLYRPEEESPEIIIEKNRHGEVGTVRCRFDSKTMRWDDDDFNDNFGRA